MKKLTEILTQEIATLDAERIVLADRIKLIDSTKRTLTAALKIQPPVESPAEPAQTN